MASSLVAFGIALAVLLALAAISAVAAIRWALVHPLQTRDLGPLDRPPLDADARDLAARLKAHVVAVASRPHNVDHYAELEAAACHIEAALARFGYQPQSQPFLCAGRWVRNIEVVLEPRLATGSAVPGTLVIGAHYDAPDDSPGANDNGTGVAALLEIARLMRLANPPLRQRVRLVFYVNEELPWGKTDMMGSLRHARRLAETGERVHGMLALETLGYFSDTPGSQQFPFPFGFLYGDRGNFVAFVGMLRGRAFVHEMVRTFREVSNVPSIGGVAPGAIEGIDLSDHWAYDQLGFPAAMVTDTAPFRNPYYHRTYDTPDTVDYAMLARITVGLEAMVTRMATR